MGPSWRPSATAKAALCPPLLPFVAPALGALPSLFGTGRFVYPVSNRSVRTHLSTNLVNKGDNTSRNIWVNSSSHDFVIFCQYFTTRREFQGL